MRLNRYLALAGAGSRRGCEELILDGAVRINGKICKELATTVTESDEVVVNGRPVHAQQLTYILLNKPVGYVSSKEDEKGRKTIFDLLTPDLIQSRLFHVGRLDRDSEGLIILTNDGEFAQRLTHPSHGVEKEYQVTLNKPFDPKLGKKLKAGIHIPIETVLKESDLKKTGSKKSGYKKSEAKKLIYKRAFAEAIGPFSSTHSRRLKLVLKQGYKRQIRLMLYSLGYEVENLTRTRIGTIKSGKLPTGAWRFLSQKEVDALRKPKRRLPKTYKAKIA